VTQGRSVRLPGHLRPAHRSVLQLSYDQPSITQDAIGEAIGAGFRHIVPGLPAPYPANVARWVTDELITTSGWGETPLVLQP